MNARSSRQRRWYVEAAGKIWGPYADDRLVAFADEGRIGVSTLVAVSPEGPFRPAAQLPELADLFPGVEPPRPAPEPIPLRLEPTQPFGQRTAATEPAPLPAAASQLTASAQPGEPTRPAAPPGARPLLVWASLGSAGVEAFEQLLAIHGPHVSLGPGLWLVRARITAAGLRNALTRRLKASEAVLVTEAALADTAWFNLDGAADRAARILWTDA
jgi:hypothetical protein